MIFAGIHVDIVFIIDRFFVGKAIRQNFRWKILLAVALSKVLALLLGDALDMSVYGCYDSYFAYSTNSSAYSTRTPRVDSRSSAALNLR